MSTPLLKAYPLLQDVPGITAFFSERGASVPTDPYDGFSVCHYTGDTEGHVAACRTILAQAAGVDVANIVIPRQIHSANVRRITTAGCPAEDTDGLVTDIPGVLLCINTADCVPLVLADPANGIIGAAHAGWRGLLAGVIENTISAMIEAGADPQNIHAGFGPFICRECFEVGPEVAEQFDNDPYYDDVAGVVLPGSNGKYFIDLYMAAYIRLRCAGLDSDSIALPTGCTFEHPDRLFSARRHGIKSGRNLTAIMINKKGSRE